jgi:hypothetical protein
MGLILLIVGRPRPPGPSGRQASVLVTVVLALVLFWLVGVVSAVTVGGYIHLILGVALVLAAAGAFQARRPV